MRLLADKTCLCLDDSEMGWDHNVGPIALETQTHHKSGKGAGLPRLLDPRRSCFPSVLAERDCGLGGWVCG